ncbi:MAG: cysteine hydrolase family protein [Oscillospiraceae bacterium]
MKKLLVVVDYQQDFVDGALGFAGAEQLEKPLYQAAEQVLAEGGYVVFTRDTHEADYLHTREGIHLPVEHCIKGTPGHRLYGALHGFETAPRPRTLLLDKPTFGSPTLARQAEELCGGAPDVVEVCGVVTDICVLANAILLHTAFPLANVRVLKGLCGSGNGANAAKALDLLAGMGIAVVE